MNVPNEVIRRGLTSDAAWRYVQDAHALSDQLARVAVALNGQKVWVTTVVGGADVGVSLWWKRERAEKGRDFPRAPAEWFQIVAYDYSNEVVHYVTPGFRETTRSLDRGIAGTVAQLVPDLLDAIALKMEAARRLRALLEVEQVVADPQEEPAGG